jgi:hypothetical protein
MAPTPKATRPAIDSERRCQLPPPPGRAADVCPHYSATLGSRTAPAALSVMHAVSKNLICGSVP